MDLESLKTKVTEKGGTQFSALSERTVNHLLEREIKRNGSDEYYTEEVIDALVSDLKEFDGNVHFEVGKKNTEYKTNFEKEWKKAHPDTKPTGGSDDPYAKLLEKFEAQEKRLEAMENARKEADKEARKEKVAESVKTALRNKFRQAGVEENEYIFRQTLRDLVVPDEDADVSKLAKEMETSYYQNLKEAGFDVEKPRYGGNGGGKGKTAADDFFTRKAKKEGWGKK